ncbi:MAG: nitrite reductase, copper-containing, partial [Gammaproteobacteria bacterium]|nr:nitrite reductase, copper-containing [Gammaproteobacteria bacterium]
MSRLPVAVRTGVVFALILGVQAAQAAQAPASYTPDVSFTLKTGIAEGRLVFIGVGGAIDGVV